MKVTRNNTRKENIANTLVERTGLPTKYCQKILTDINTISTSFILEKKILKIKNFGSFILKRKKARNGRDPKNKINYKISERNVVIFKASENVKKKLNNHVRK